MKWLLGFESTKFVVRNKNFSSSIRLSFLYGLSSVRFMLFYISFFPIMYNVKIPVCLKVEVILDIWLTKHVVGHVGILLLLAEKICEISTNHKLESGSHVAFQIRLKEYFVQDLPTNILINSNVHLAQWFQKNKNEIRKTLQRINDKWQPTKKLWQYVTCHFEVSSRSNKHFNTINLMANLSRKVI